MNFSDLKVFQTVAQTGGITRAATQLHRVPSNVTTRLRQLEADLGTPLFLRNNKRLSITPAGQLLLGYAERILALTQEARDALQDPAPRGTLRLGTMESTAATRLPGPLAEFHRLYPQVTLELSTGPTRPLVVQVLAGELDAALVADPAADDRLASLQVFTEELVLVAEAGQPRIRTPKDVRQATMLAFGSGCTYRRRLEEWFASGGVAPQRIVELASYHAILGCAVAGMGVALLPRGLLALFPQRERLSLHPLPATVAHTATQLVWRQGAQSGNVLALSQLLQAP